jgi:dehydrogenase/reductase SDR family protein 12
MIDTLLDRTVLFGYGRTGLWARRRLPGWPPDPPRLDGKVALVTGAASGLGLAASRGFARLGARVLVVGRNAERAQDAAAQVRETVMDAIVTPLACDISSLADVRALSRLLADQEAQLDILVHNAGVMPERRERSPDGQELTFATHVLGPFALIRWTRELLERGAPSRVIIVSSGGMYARAFACDDPASERESYSATRFYATTKREQVVIAEQWAERLRDAGVAVHAMHPGWADTKGVRDSLPAFAALTKPIIRTPEQGADTIVWLGGSAEGLSETGGFWHDRRRRPTRYRVGASAEPDECRRRLWDYCSSIVERFES